jgi:CBS domain-containing protein
MTNRVPKKVLVRDVMTKKVVSISPDMSIFEAAKIISEHNFDGLPVTDKENRIIGILTEYDLIMRTSTANATFLQKILTEVYSKQTDNAKDAVEESAREISSLKVSDIMNREPLVLKDDAAFDEVIAAFITHHRVKPIVDTDNKVVGIVSRFDVLRPLNLLGYGSPNK